MNVTLFTTPMLKLTIVFIGGTLKRIVYAGAHVRQLVTIADGHALYICATLTRLAVANKNNSTVIVNFDAI